MNDDIFGITGSIIAILMFVFIFVVERVVFKLTKDSEFTKKVSDKMYCLCLIVFVSFIFFFILYCLGVFK